MFFPLDGQKKRKIFENLTHCFKVINCPQDNLNDESNIYTLRENSN